MDWIDAFMDYTDPLPSPPIFRQWAAITAVGAAMERRVVIQTRQGSLYPNLFTLLVAPPGVGKTQAINPVQKLWRSTRNPPNPGMFVAPDSLTKAALVDALERSKRTIILPENQGILEYNSLAIASGEFGVLVPAHDLGFLSVLNNLFDCPDVFQEERRSLDNVIDIINPQISILAATQPGFLASLLPEEAWVQGFTSRLLMVHSNEAVELDIFGEMPPGQGAKFARLTSSLINITNLLGNVEWTKEAQKAFTKWYKNGCLPVPDHARLLHYKPRRHLHLLKLCCISAVSRTQALVIDQNDVERALGWLLTAEQTMPAIFREMAQRSDSQIMQETHLYLWQLFTKVKQPIPQSVVYEFLSSRMGADKIGNLIEVMIRSGFLSRIDGNTPDTVMFMPRPRAQMGEVA